MLLVIGNLYSSNPLTRWTKEKGDKNKPFEAIQIGKNLVLPMLWPATSRMDLLSLLKELTSGIIIYIY